MYNNQILKYMNIENKAENKTKYVYFTKEEILNFNNTLETSKGQIMQLSDCFELFSQVTESNTDLQTKYNILEKSLEIARFTFNVLDEQFDSLDKLQTYIEHLHGLSSIKHANSFKPTESEQIINRIMEIENKAV